MSKKCTTCGCVSENDNARFCCDCGAQFERPSGVRSSGKLNVGVTNNSSQKISEEETKICEEVAAAENEEVSTSEVDKELQDDVVNAGSQFIDDDDSDYDLTECENIQPINNQRVIDDDSETNECFDEQAPIQEDKSFMKSFLSMFQKKDSEHTEGHFTQGNDFVTNDPYYDDVLPEINNEKNVIQKDIIVKLVSAFIAMIIVIFLMIYMLG